MIEDSQTPPQEIKELVETEDDFAVNAKWQEEAAERARRVVDAPEQNEPATQPAWTRRQKALTGLALTGAALFGGGTAVAAVDHMLPGKEVGSSSTSIRSGEGVEAAVYRDIAEIESTKIDPADSTERQDVVSQAVEFHTDSNNVVQPGEMVTVVAEKSPIFGNVTYKAVDNDPQVETK